VLGLWFYLLLRARLRWLSAFLRKSGSKHLLKIVLGNHNRIAFFCVLLLWVKVSIGRFDWIAECLPVLAENLVVAAHEFRVELTFIFFSR
jgi:hypothetical protein